jgi:hypothetical protein
MQLLSVSASHTPPPPSQDPEPDITPAPPRRFATRVANPAHLPSGAPYVPRRSTGPTWATGMYGPHADDYTRQSVEELVAPAWAQEHAARVAAQLRLRCGVPLALALGLLLPLTLLAYTAELHTLAKQGVVAPVLAARLAWEGPGAADGVSPWTGATPLHHACFAHAPACASVLLAANASVVIKDLRGVTPAALCLTQLPGLLPEVLAAAGRRGLGLGPLACPTARATGAAAQPACRACDPGPCPAVCATWEPDAPLLHLVAQGWLAALLGSCGRGGWGGAGAGAGAGAGSTGALPWGPLRDAALQVTRACTGTGHATGLWWFPDPCAASGSGVGSEGGGRPVAASALGLLVASTMVVSTCGLGAQATAAQAALAPVLADVLADVVATGSQGHGVVGPEVGVAPLRLPAADGSGDPVALLPTLLRALGPSPSATTSAAVAANGTSPAALLAALQGLPPGSLPLHGLGCCEAGGPSSGRGGGGGGGRPPCPWADVCLLHVVSPEPLPWLLHTLHCDPSVQVVPWQGQGQGHPAPDAPSPRSILATLLGALGALDPPGAHPEPGSALVHHHRQVRAAIAYAVGASVGFHLPPREVQFVVAGLLGPAWSRVQAQANVGDPTMRAVVRHAVGLLAGTGPGTGPPRSPRLSRPPALLPVVQAGAGRPAHAPGLYLTGDQAHGDVWLWGVDLLGDAVVMASALTSHPVLTVVVGGEGEEQGQGEGHGVNAAAAAAVAAATVAACEAGLEGSPTASCHGAGAGGGPRLGQGDQGPHPDRGAPPATALAMVGLNTPCDCGGGDSDPAVCYPVPLVARAGVPRWWEGSITLAPSVGQLVAARREVVEGAAGGRGLARGTPDVYLVTVCVGGGGAGLVARVTASLGQPPPQ